MTRPKIAIIALAAALVVSNAWWLHVAIDDAITRSYLSVSLEDNKVALDQTLALLPVVAQPGMSRGDIVAAARHPQFDVAPFEKDGFVWVGRIGLKFNPDGQLVRVARAWE